MSSNQKEYRIHISSKQKGIQLNLKEVWQYKDLIWLFTKRSFKLIYKQTILGPAWIILNPLISSIMYTIVFGGIAGIATDGVPQILFYLGGSAIWTLFSSNLTQNSTTFVNNASVFGKVYFPRLTMPMSISLSSIIQFCVQMILVILFWLYFVISGVVHPNWVLLLAIPFVLIHLSVLGMGLGILISSLTTKYRDLAMLVGFGVQLWMYATPIVYPLSQIPVPALKTIIMYNPVTMPVELFRSALFGVGDVSILYYVISIVITVVVFLFGTIVFNKVEKTFMDTV